MTSAREEATVEDGTEISDHSHTDYPLGISRHSSLASSRFSSRISWCSGTRDVAQSLDEFLRKQRVIRYMQEERERSMRSKLLREEHDAWVHFRNCERGERLTYMSEQEVAELLQREAEEATRESNGADQRHQQATQDALQRRQSMARVGRRDEDTVLVPPKTEAPVDEARRVEPREASEKSGIMSVAEHERCLIMQLQQGDEGLKVKCTQLTGELEESRGAVALAQRSQKCAEDNLAREKEKTQREKITAQSRKETNGKLVNELAELQQKLTAMEREKKKLEAAKLQAVRDVAQREEELATLKRHNAELVAQHSAQKAAAEDEKRRVDLCREELKVCQDALKREQAARGNAESQLEALREQAKALEAKVAAARVPDPQQEAKNMRRLKAVADDARMALADLLKEREARERAEVVVAETKAALAQEQAAREKAEKDLQVALATPTVTLPQPQRTESNLKRLAEAERKVEEMRKARNRDEVEKAALRRAMQKLQKDRDNEAAARAQFEQLALQAVGAEDRVPREEVVRLRRELQASQKKCDTARRETLACQQNAACEIESLKAWCKRLQGQLLLQSDDEFTPRTVMPTPHSRTPRTGRGQMPKVPAVAQRQADEKAASDQRIDELEADVTQLREGLEKTRPRELWSFTEPAKVSKPSSACTTEPIFPSPKTSANGTRPKLVKEPEAEEKMLVERLECLGGESAETRSKYKDLIASLEQAEAARCEAERQVAAQRVLIEELQNKESSLHLPAMGNRVTTLSEPIAASSNGNMTALGDRIKELERLLIEERAARETAEKCAEELRKDGSTLATEARPLATPTEARFATSGGGAKHKPQKVKGGCF
ncbi:hypothetical protein JKF63_04021 [Porcisia hertigi]|uniref:200 kDa antigen p200 n=1 Tax=Porcisia hertigi TaxID=2761500 RepID=A0A836HUE4_9TRYP|nr:hypothetical protein JKF63_04021 [Porcisia hertigi]